jgi:DNA-binding NarL/FixJ family response regulator
MDDPKISPSAASSPLRILIADDSAPVRRLVKDLLGTRPDDWVVCAECPDGQETLRQARELHPDVVLLDLSIPVLSGMETAAALRRDRPDTVVVIMSAQESSVLQRLAKAANLEYFLSKSSFADGMIPLLETIAHRRNNARNGSA